MYDDLCEGAMGIKTSMANKEPASKHQKHQMEGSICIEDVWKTATCIEGCRRTNTCRGMI